MKQNFFTHLPPETITNILSRLPIQSIAISKCVCKPWLHLLESNEFVHSHLAKSVPALVTLQSTQEWDSSSFTIFKLEDGHELETHDLHYNPLTKFDFPHSVTVEGSANGLLFLSKFDDTHYVCNPITRDYIEVLFPKELIRPYRKVFSYPEYVQDSVCSYPPFTAYGFGASKISDQYKVVRIFHDSVIAHVGEAPARIIPEPECHVYTVGTGSWRRVEPPGDQQFDYSGRTSCVFLDGSLHWIVSDSDDKLWISCFDLETESFSSFPTPPLFQESFELKPGMTALGDCLCLCDHTREEETVIWLMKESWTKGYVININESLDIEGFELVYPLKVFEDGDILMLREELQLFYYSSKTETAREIVPGLALLMPKYDSNMCTIFEFEDGLDLERHHIHYNPLTEFDFPHHAIIWGSANGLLLLYKLGLHDEALYVCNPITRDYVELHYPKELECRYPQVVTFGFGASNISGQHKVVRIFNDSINAKYECHAH